MRGNWYPNTILIMTLQAWSPPSLLRPARSERPATCCLTFTTCLVASSVTTPANSCTVFCSVRRPSAISCPAPSAPAPPVPWCMFFSVRNHFTRVFTPARVSLPPWHVPANKASKTDRWLPWTCDVGYATSIILAATIPQFHDDPSCQTSDILRISPKTDLVYTTARLLLLHPLVVRLHRLLQPLKPCNCSS